MHARHMVENIRILIVEDGYFVMSDVGKIIAGSGGNVCLAYNDIRSDMCQFDFSSIDVALLDIDLIGELSCNIATALDEMNIPFAFYASPENKLFSEKYLDIPRLAKPCHEQELIDTIAQLARRDQG